MEETIKKMEEYLVLRGYRKRTQEAYLSELKKFYKYRGVAINKLGEEDE